jgi:hypothetical protein
LATLTARLQTNLEQAMVCHDNIADAQADADLQE